jgi:hypothetical protein
LKIGDTIGNNDEIHTNHGRNTEFVQATTNRNTINVQDKLVAKNAPSKSLSAAIKATPGSSPQLKQVFNNSRRLEILWEIR